jgi:hypothetical protein
MGKAFETAVTILSPHLIEILLDPKQNFIAVRHKENYN